MGTSRSRSFLVCLLTGIVWTPFATSLAAAVAAQSAADIFDPSLPTYVRHGARKELE